MDYSRLNSSEPMDEGLVYDPYTEKWVRGDFFSEIWTAVDSLAI